MNFNKNVAADLIRFADKDISRADLAEEMGLTRAAVTVIISDLISSGIILENAERASARWRRRSMSVFT
jgi:CRP-like cAMP-binding protein